MIDIRTEEDAALYVLDLLNGLERQRFQARLEREPALAQYVRKLADDTALLALNAPRLDAPPNTFARITQAIHAQPSSRPKNIIVLLNRVPAAWPMAACFFLTFTVLLLLADRVGNADLHNLSGDRKEMPAISFDLRKRLEKLEALEKANQEKAAELRAKQAALTALEDKLEDTESDAQTSERERQLLARQLQKIAEIETLYRNTGPGVARLTVMDLTDGPNIVPDAKALIGHKSDKNPSPDSGAMQDTRSYILTPMAESKFTGPAPKPSTANDAASSDAIVPEFIKNALVPAGTSDTAFVGDAAGMEIIGTAAGAFSTSATLTSSSQTDPDDATSTPPESTDDPDGDGTTSQYAPSATVIYDGNNIRLLAYDLRTPPDGRMLVAYIVDPKYPEPIRAGTIQNLDKSGSGSFLSTPNVQNLTPTNFYISEEPIGGGQGKIILSAEWPKTSVP
ncbi:MAG: hypothetical protein SFY80_12320 [Verrucomicrobiota bacterium]|nr:hypothetical protein [Verrucomicrobiota bacterium]